MQTRRPSPPKSGLRRGAATLDYLLLLGVIFAAGAVLVPLSQYAINVVYDIICTLVAWPFV